MDEVFGGQNFIDLIYFRTTGGFATKALSRIGDYLIWFAKDASKLKYRQLYQKKTNLETGDDAYKYIELPNGGRRVMTREEREGKVTLPDGARIFRLGDLTGQGGTEKDCPFEFEGKTYKPNANSHWKANYPEGMERLRRAKRIMLSGNTLSYVRYLEDNPVNPINNAWMDTGHAGFASEKVYVVETNKKVVERAVLMTTDPGDLVLDITCGSGTTAYVAEEWGRRWITSTWRFYRRPPIQCYPLWCCSNRTQRPLLGICPYRRLS
jgi:adenine-specific DNA-methyltransferase